MAEAGYLYKSEPLDRLSSYLASSRNPLFLESVSPVTSSGRRVLLLRQHYYLINMPSIPTFCDLKELVDSIQDNLPPPKCAFLKDKRQCKMKINGTTVAEAKMVVNEYRGILTTSSGKSIDTSLQNILQEIATKCLCRVHNKYDASAKEQWLKELSAHTVITAHSPEPEYDSYSEGVDLYDEPNISEEREDVTILPSQSASLIKTARRTLTMTEDDMARDVTCLLAQPATGQSKGNGFIYAVSFSRLPGKFKVGFSSEKPEHGRLSEHELCYGEYDILMTKLIPNVYRVEQLVLTEFTNKHYKLKDACQRHKPEIRHRELLAVEKEDLLETLDKWIKFIESEPYSKEGNLTDKAKERLPLPALKSYLDCKPTRRRISTGLTPRKKKEVQDSQIVSSTASNSEVSSLAKGSVTISVQVTQADLCLEIDKIRLTPQKDGQKAL